MQGLHRQPVQADRGDRKRNRDATPEAAAVGGLVLVLQWREPDGAPTPTAKQLATAVRKLLAAMKRRANHKKGSFIAAGEVLSAMISPGRGGGPSEGVVQLNSDELTEKVAGELNGGSLNGQEVLTSCRAVGQSSSSSETPVLERAQRARPAPERESSEETDTDEEDKDLKKDRRALRGRSCQDA